MAEYIKIPLKHIYKVDASNRKGHSNAAVIGIGKSQKIIICDTLISGMFTVDEIKAIVAHELGHWHNYDQHKKMLFITIEFSFVFYLLSLVINNMAILNSFGFSEKSNFASLIIVMKIYEVLIFITGKLQTIFIRMTEFRADQFALSKF
jgi:STE24 endopeptidase